MSAKKYMNKYRIETIRKPGWDYRREAVYFVTICTQKRILYFGNIVNGEMILSDLGQIAKSFWKEIPKHFPFIELKNFVVMPNHVHGLLGIKVDLLHATNPQSFPDCNNQCKNESMANISPKRGSLPSVIRSYKSAVTRYANQNKIEFGWQSLYHDHIVRNDDEFVRIDRYITNNPKKWHDDDLY